jgi:hypothetical protein
MALKEYKGSKHVYAPNRIEIPPGARYVVPTVDGIAFATELGTITDRWVIHRIVCTDPVVRVCKPRSKQGPRKTTKKK